MIKKTLTPEEELLARLGRPVCRACGRLYSGKGVSGETFITGIGYVHPCSKICALEIHRYQNELTRRDRERRHEAEVHMMTVYRDQLKAMYEPSSMEYRRAVQEHAGDLEEATWYMGNGLFGPVED